MFKKTKESYIFEAVNFKIMQPVKISKRFKQMATKAMFAILFFITVYLLLIALAIGIFIACIYGAIAVVAIRPSLITLMLGLGIASVGVFILYFLIKFLFKKNKTDNSHLTEIDIKSEPKLHAMLQELVSEIGTDFPKKIYLSSEVNASVFYNSSFWSMFLPVKKNLHIGLGLVNSTTISEFKGILAHEFGHFSQKSMKVGSYVYNVNKIIYDMLYDNESYEKSVQSWANTSNYSIIFMGISITVVRGIQWILRKTYDVVNISYMSLSREMEFHADEIAANIVGSEPMKNSMLRMSLADESYNEVLNFYSGKISEAITTDNIFPKQFFIMTFLAAKNKIENLHGIPNVTFQNLDRFNKSKLVIKNQWASHPSSEERIAAFDRLNIPSVNIENNFANTLFENIEMTQQRITDKLFKVIEYQQTPAIQNINAFEQEFQSNFDKNAFPEVYNGYYDNYNPLAFNVDSEINSISESTKTFEELFDDSKMDNILSLYSLKKDIGTLEEIIENENTIKLKTFDYDGNKYKIRDTRRLVAELKNKQKDLEQLILKNDIAIFRFFYCKSEDRTNKDNLSRLYHSFFSADSKYDELINVYTTTYSSFSFVFQTLEYDAINRNMKNFRINESHFRTKLKEVTDAPGIQSIITPEIKENITAYLAEEIVYFSNNNYNDANISILFTVLGNYLYLVQQHYFNTKKQLLVFQTQLL